MSLSGAKGSSIRTLSRGQLEGPSEALSGQPEVLPEAVTPALDHDGLLPVPLLRAPVLDGKLAVSANDAEGLEVGPPPSHLCHPPPSTLNSPLSPVLLVPPFGVLDGKCLVGISETVSKSVSQINRTVQCVFTLS